MVAAIGALIGIGFQTKYTMAFYTSGIVAGVLLTRARRYLASRMALGRGSAGSVDLSAKSNLAGPARIYLATISSTYS